MKKPQLVSVLAFTVIAILVFANSCKKCCQDPSNPECENYDPCLGKLTSADFLIYGKGVSDYYAYWRNSLQKIDTLYNDGILLCTKAKHDSVKWKVGLEQNYRTQDSCYVSFGLQRVGKVSITCIVFRQPNTQCFPNDDGVDTVTKSVYVAKFEDVPILGKFKGMFLNDPVNPDSFEITFRHIQGLSNFVMDSMDHKVGWADWQVPALYVGPYFYYKGNGMTAFPKDVG
jgi:hypothetical protein